MPSLDRRVTYAGRYFANKELRNMPGDRRQDCQYDHRPCRRSPRVFTYNALGNTVRKLQNRRRQRPDPPAATVQSMGRPPELTQYAVY